MNLYKEDYEQIHRWPTVAMYDLLPKHKLPQTLSTSTITIDVQLFIYRESYRFMETMIPLG